MTIVAEPTLAAQLGLDRYGIKGATDVIRNPSYEQLFAEETRPIWRAMSAAWKPSSAPSR